MKTQSIRRAVSGTVAAAVVLAGAAIFAAPAHAAVVGTLSFNPAIGVAGNTTAYQTSGVCSNAADNVKVTVVGGSGTGAVLTLPKNIVGAGIPVPNGSGMAVPFFQTWTDFATTNSLTVLNGVYTVSAVCTVSLDHFDGQVTFTGTDKVNASYIATSVTPVATTTALSTATASIGFGSSATVTATVASGSGIPSGTVQFKVDNVNSGAPVAVSAGSATFNTPTNLAAGAHSITAAYAPDTNGTANGWTASTSTGLTITVGTVTPTVTFTQNPTTAAQGGSTLLTAAISPASLAGTVQFAADGVNIGSAVAVSAGSASTTWSISPTATVGNHALTAQFVPTDTVNVSTPAAATATFAVSATSVQITNVNNTITVSVPLGTLSITTPAAMTLTFGSPYLSSNGKYFIATGGVTPVVISDTRAGDPGWHVDVLTTDFNGTKGGVNFATGPNFNPRYPWQQNVINGLNLGFVDNFLTAPTALPSPNGTTTMNTGLVLVPVNAANGLTPSTNPVLPGATSTTGLGGTIAHRIINATGGQGIGSATGDAEFSGHFQLNIPTVTISDTYTSVFTYTLTSN